MRNSHESLYEAFRALAAFAQPTSFRNRYFRKPVELFFVVFYYFSCSDELRTDNLSAENSHQAIQSVIES